MVVGHDNQGFAPMIGCISDMGMVAVRLAKVKRGVSTRESRAVSSLGEKDTNISQSPMNSCVGSTGGYAPPRPEPEPYNLFGACGLHPMPQPPQTPLKRPWTNTTAYRKPGTNSNHLLSQLHRDYDGYKRMHRISGIWEVILAFGQRQVN